MSSIQQKEEKGSPGSMYNLGLLAAFVQVVCQEWVIRVLILLLLVALLLFLFLRICLGKCSVVKTHTHIRIWWWKLQHSPHK